MRKGVQIAWIRLDGKHVDVMARDGSLIKVTRAQRELLRKYKNPTYLEDIRKAFSNDDIVAKDYIVLKEGEQVFPK